MSKRNQNHFTDCFTFNKSTALYMGYIRRRKNSIKSHFFSGSLFLASKPRELIFSYLTPNEHRREDRSTFICKIDKPAYSDLVFDSSTLAQHTFNDPNRDAHRSQYFVALQRSSRSPSVTRNRTGGRFKVSLG